MPTLAPSGQPAAPDAPRPVVLIPPVPQALWGWPAVINFAAGGLGAGLYAVAAAGAGGTGTPALGLASWLGPALALAGFAAVATEAGRPLRGIRVLTRVRTSWMSRELWLGGAFVALAASEPLLRWPGQRALAVAAAVLLAVAQGCILREARGVAVWAVPLMPVVFLSSALVSGAGLLLLVEAGRGGVPQPLIGAALALLSLHLVVWWRLLTWSEEPAFAHAVRGLHDGCVTLAVVGGGYLAPSLLGALAVALPVAAGLLAPLAGALMIAGQVYAKAAIVLRAGELRPVTVPNLRLARRS